MIEVSTRPSRNAAILRTAQLLEQARPIRLPPTQARPLRRAATVKTTLLTAVVRDK